MNIKNFFFSLLTTGLLVATTTHADLTFEKKIHIEKMNKMRIILLMNGHSIKHYPILSNTKPFYIFDIHRLENIFEKCLFSTDTEQSKKFLQAFIQLKNFEYNFIKIIKIKNNRESADIQKDLIEFLSSYIQSSEDYDLLETPYTTAFALFTLLYDDFVQQANFIEQEQQDDSNCDTFFKQRHQQLQNPLSTALGTCIKTYNLNTDETRHDACEKLLENFLELKILEKILSNKKIIQDEVELQTLYDPKQQKVLTMAEKINQSSEAPQSNTKEPQASPKLQPKRNPSAQQLTPIQKKLVAPGMLPFLNAAQRRSSL